MNWGWEPYKHIPNYGGGPKFLEKDVVRSDGNEENLNSIGSHVDI